MNTLGRIGIALATAVLAISALVVTNANAQTRKYGSEAGWDIFVNDNMGPGCLAAKKLSPETHIEMGINATRNPRIGYMAVYTKAQANISQGEHVTVMFDVDGEKFSGTAMGQQVQGFRGGSVPVNNVDFIYDLAKKKTLTITPQEGEPIVVSLAGTDAAFKALRTCQEAQ